MPKLDNLLLLHSKTEFSIPKIQRVDQGKAFKDLLLVSIPFPWIMRSSFAIEDGKDYAFAGMFNSYFPISNENEFKEGLTLCTEIPPRAILYAEKAGYSKKLSQPEIFIQEFIVGDFSGVIFSAYKNSIIRMEIVPGILAPFVQGDVRFPMVVEIDRKKREPYIRKPFLDSNYTTLEAGKVVQKQFSGIGLEARVKYLLVDILECVDRIESIFGCPQDIEFTVRDTTIYILQSRPISA